MEVFAVAALTAEDVVAGAEDTGWILDRKEFVVFIAAGETLASDSELSC